MHSLAKKIAIVVASLIGIGMVLGWLLLSSSLLAKPRGELIAKFLTNKLGQVVEIDGASVKLGTVVGVTAVGISLPSSSMSDITLAEIGKLEMGVALADLWQGQIKLQDPTADAVNVMLVVDGKGAQSWSMPKVESEQSAQPSKMPGDQPKSLIDLLADRRFQLTNSHIIYQDARNGLDLDLQLTSLELSQIDPSAPFVLEGAGALNGEEMTLAGSFLKDQPFNMSVAFNQMHLSLDGEPHQSGYKGELSLNVDELGQLQDALKLTKSVTGTGHARVAYDIGSEENRISELSVVAQLDTGQSVEVTGDLGVLGDPSDVTIYTDVRLYPEDNSPPPTTSRQELKLVAIEMELVAQPSGIPNRAMVIETNGFVLDTKGVGQPPIYVSEISRTSDGKLRLGKAVLRIGPPEAPFMILEGAIGDALRLEEIDLVGTLALPAASLLAPELFQVSDALGTVSGGFRLQGNGKVLGLSDLTAVTEGTDLWDLKVSGSVRNALNIGDVALNVSVDVPSSAELLEAMGLEQVETDKVALKANVSSKATKWELAASIAMDDSELAVGANVDMDEPRPILRGQIESELIRIEHLRQIVATYIQLKKLNQLEKDAKQGAGLGAMPKDEPEIQPLVLNEPDPTSPAADNEPDPKGPIRDVTLLPMGQAILLSGSDLGVTIDLRKIEGAKGTSSLKSKLEMKDHKARLGPLNFEYGGAHVELSGTMDLIEEPDVVHISGSTGGWNFGEIMHELKFKKQASGVLHGNFDVSGSHLSVSGFVGSLTGSATVSLTNGHIDTQLLDLAGLGILPWVFSKDKGEVARIVCARAPMYFSRGSMTTKQTVVETDLVQVVVYGDVNLRAKTMNIAGQPRKIGKPLSRSPWRFTVHGPFANPKVKLKDGPKHLARSDGATMMPAKRKLCVPDILQLK